YGLDGRSLDDTRRALAAAGYAVEVPRRQGCCGAVDLHAGRPAVAARLARRNLAAFSGTDPVVVCASGCAATLLEYRRVAGDGGAGLARRVADPAELLAAAELALRAGPYRDVVLHIPCSQRHGTGSADATRRLLARLPGVAVRELPAGCCGAAGEHFLSQPGLADRLVAPLVAGLQANPPDALVTSNIGCALHFGAALRRAGLELPVLHPSSLVVAALESGL
ncbi:(Fe-S)-binding protein, partial [Thioalkalivibrio sp. XN8]|uniref:(Fe-S)-binding protein n=1 Tax=Thioalkalivibrio sp. XN8 TaxID=2712863 RepID=UPI0013EB535C